MHAQSLRQILQDGTRDVHEALDQGIGAFRNASDYRRYLGGTYAFRAAVEPALAAIPSLGWQPVWLTALLRDDLADLDLPLPQTLPQVPGLDTAVARVAALYVIEGSGLGARVLCRRAEALGFTATHGARHLAQQTAGKGRWGRFLTWMQAQQDAAMPAHSAGDRTAPAPDATAANATATARAIFALAGAAYGVGVQA